MTYSNRRKTTNPHPNNHQPNPQDPRTRSHPRNSNFSAYGGTTLYGAAAGSGDDDGYEKRRSAITKTWQER
jgi:hypothetical protein